MPKEPLIAIGMPVYNGAVYLEAAVGSLLNQTEDNFQLLISDDCSQDQTLAICERFAARDPRIRLIRQDQHLGMTRNFNYVLQEAKSRFFMWAAQDDLWTEEFLRDTTQLLLADEQAIACATSVQHIDSTGALLHLQQPPPELTANNAAVRARAVISHRPHAEYSVFRRALIPGQPRDTWADVAGGDVAFVFRVALHGRFAIAERPYMMKRSVGYSSARLADGTPGWEKSLGPDGHLYSHSVSGMCRSMSFYLGEVPIPTMERAAVRGAILRLRIRGWRNMMANRNQARLLEARNRRQRARSGWLLLQQVALAPRATLATTMRRARNRSTPCSPT
jgi:hypothetical protein